VRSTLSSVNTDRSSAGNVNDSHPVVVTNKLTTVLTYLHVVVFVIDLRDRLSQR